MHRLNVPTRRRRLIARRIERALVTASDETSRRATNRLSGLNALWLTSSKAATPARLSIVWMAARMTLARTCSTKSLRCALSGVEVESTECSVETSAGSHGAHFHTHR